MPHKKTIARRLQHAHLQLLRRSPELDANIDQFLSVVCDTSRRYILELLAQPNENDNSLPCELRSGEIAGVLGLSSATTSEHLRLMADLHLVTARKQGTAVYYRLSDHRHAQAFLDLLHLLDDYYQSS